MRVFTAHVNLARQKRRLIKAVRFYPLLVGAILAFAYLFGAFEERVDPLIARDTLITSLYIWVGVVPTLFIIAFALLARATDKESQKITSKRFKSAAANPFLLPNEKMHGYKLALITNRPPTLTGLTGDSYSSDDQAVCSEDDQHVPPVLDCECGFYAYKDYEEAKFELSLNPSAFLIDVDLFGLGLVYKRGYRAESQVVNQLLLPKRCMRCHLMPAQIFVADYQIGFGDSPWWRWQIRCTLCSRGVKEKNRMSIAEMKKVLAIAQ